MKNVHVIEIEIEKTEWSKILDDTFKKKKKDVKIDGFRKGSITKEMYLKKLGIESLYPDAIDAALPVAYAKCLKENKLVPIIEPSVDVKHICDTCVTFEFTITTKPEVKLGKYTNLGIKKDTVKVSNDEIDAEIKTLQDRYAEIIVKEKGKVEKGNTAVINFEGTVDGKKLDGGSGENYPLEIGSNTFIPGFEEGLIGMSILEEKVLDLKFPADYVEELKNKAVTFKVKILEIKERVLPKLTKEFFEDLGYEGVTTEEELKNYVKADITKKKEQEAEDKYLDEALNAAANNIKVELSDAIIDDELTRMINQYREQLSYQGITLEQYFEFTKTTEADLKDKMKEEAVKRIKSRYLLEGIIDAEKIEVSKDEADKEADEISKQYQMTKEEFIKAFGGLEILMYDMKMRKALDFLRK